MKFSRKPIAQTNAGKILASQNQVDRVEQIKERKKAINAGYERGWIKIGERVIFVRSRWDGNVACYLEWLKQNGKIKKWAYEQKTFWFDKIKRGTNNYKPDFWVEENDGFIHYIEVKAFWTKKDSVKMKRMSIYHKGVDIFVLADDKCFERINNEFPDDGKYIFKYHLTYNEILLRSVLVRGINQPFLKREEIEHLIPLKLKPEKKKKAP